MMASLTVSPLAKKPRLEQNVIDPDRCVLCFDKFSDRNRKGKAVSPDLNKIDSLFDACRKMKNKAANLILESETSIRNGSLNVYYHRDCRSQFVTVAKRRILVDDSKAQCSTGGDGDWGSGSSSSQYGGGESTSTGSYTRSQTSSFNWKEDCFICGMKCQDKKRSSWSMVECAIDVDPNKPNLYSKILSAAKLRDDKEMMARLHGVGNGDLVAVEARYHRKKMCVTTYLNPLNIAAESNKAKVESDSKQILQIVIEEFKVPILEQKEVILLTTLKKRFSEIAKEKEKEVSTRNFKTNLKDQWKEITFIPQPGRSDLVCAGTVTVEDAISKAFKLKKVLNLIEEDDISEDDSLETEAPDEDSIVHMAVGILRRRIKAHTTKLKNEYYSPDEIKLESLRQKFIDPMLHKTVRWLMDEKAYQDATDPPDLNGKCLDICCDITTAATSIYSPKHLGLAVHLHNDYGSRKLIEDMYNLGYCISYTELRCFLTSAAQYISTTCDITPSGGIVPVEIATKAEGGSQPINVGDNWDHLENTIDGKNTTHAMTSIILSPKIDGHLSLPRIPRTGSRTLSSEHIPGGSLAAIKLYRKPKKRPEPVLHPPPSVQEIIPSDIDLKEAEMTELVYNVARAGVFCDSSDDIPPWSPFHATVPPTVDLDVSTVAFNPIIMAPPTDYNTIYTTLLRFKETTNACGFQCVPAFFDMGLLTKALEVIWACQDELSDVVACEGGMHLLMSVICGIGHLYGEAGLKHLLYESGVYAEGTVKNILAGRDFDRAIRGLELVDEVLTKRFLIQFKEWCTINGKVVANDIQDCLVELNDAFTSDNKSENVSQSITNAKGKCIEHLVPLMDEFRSEGRQTSPTFSVWDDFLCYVLLPFKVFISATRLGDWKASQAAKAKLLPFLFVSNRSTYAKYMCVQLLQMKRLPIDVMKSFNDGGFVAKLAEGKFNAVWADYALEVTENKALKGSGGIIGLTMRGNALARYFLARPLTAKYSMIFHHEICSSQAQLPEGSHEHHDDKPAERKKWDTAVSKMNAMFNESFIDPFDLTRAPKQLINFATGAVASKDVEQNMIGLMKTGKDMATKFVSERLERSEDQTQSKKSFHDPMPRRKSPTMADTKVPVQVQSKNVHIDNDTAYRRLMAVNVRKGLPFPRVMSFENSATPMSMFNEDGSMLLPKTKSDFMHKLEDMLNEKVSDLTDADCTIFDAHALVRMLPFPPESSFETLAGIFINYIMNTSNKLGCGKVKQIHVVFDRYFEESIKGQARKSRGDTRDVDRGQFCVTLGGKLREKKERFLSQGSNKAGLAKVYTEFIAEKYSPQLPQNMCIYASGGLDDKVIKVSVEDVCDVPELQSNQEEADTRIILHCKFASENGADKIVVSSPDTDVLVLLLHHRTEIKSKEVFFLTGTEGRHTNQRRFIPVHELFDKLTADVQNIALEVYCLTGCDTSSSFVGHGKRSAFKVLRNKASQLQDMSGLGSGLPTKEQVVACTKFLVALYGGETESLNDLRCVHAATNTAPKKLPPTDNSFFQHVLRCCYQLYIWKHALTGIQNLPAVTDFGWERDQETHALHPTLMTQSCAPPELLHDLVCTCTANHCYEDCSCLANGQSCTMECACKAALPGLVDTEEAMVSICTNPLTLNAYFDVDTDSDSD